MRPTTLTLGNRQIGEGQPCFLLAEVASAHGGSPETALRMIDAAFKMGADGIKFQLFRAEQLVVRRHPARRDFDTIEIAPEKWKTILKEAKASGLALFIEAFDLASLDLALEFEADAFKIHTTDMENPDFIRAVGAARRPVFFATGGVPETAIHAALDLIGTSPIGLLCGYQTFPTPIEETRLRELAVFKERYRVPVGFLDHTDGGSAFALVAPALAALIGADLVEKHFTLNRQEKGFDYQSSLNPEDFYRMVELVRQTERACGDGVSSGGDGAERYHRMMARSIVAAALIPRGQVLTAEMLAAKRLDPRIEPGYAPRQRDCIIGRRAARPIQADEAIRDEMLE
ncbi:MAG: N-acetylneuraminate synthase family protein [Vicinamibacteria bacterium]|jgi:sialic acid synthase SpsE|nr:N-acetylneuraminate synthase family protein [Vicinamibacteria bacterium]